MHTWREQISNMCDKQNPYEHEGKTVQTSEEWIINKKNVKGVENLKEKKNWNISQFVWDPCAGP